MSTAARLGQPVHSLWSSSAFAASDPAAERTMLCLPHRDRPVLVLPAAPRKVAAAVLNDRLSGSGIVRRCLRSAAVNAARTGVLAHLPRSIRVIDRMPAGDLDDVLSNLLGREVVSAAYLGRPRANRKPVLQVLSPQGQTIAYAKIGVDELTNALVDAECRTLERLSHSAYRSFVHPVVLGRTHWHGNELVVQSALPTRHLARPSAALVRQAEAEIASLGSHPDGPVLDSAFWRGLADRAERLPAGPQARQLREALSTLGRCAPERPSRFGAWHGDWTWWNMAARRRPVAGVGLGALWAAGSRGIRSTALRLPGHAVTRRCNESPCGG